MKGSLERQPRDSLRARRRFPQALPQIGREIWIVQATVLEGEVVLPDDRLPLPGLRGHLMEPDLVRTYAGDVELALLQAGFGPPDREENDDRRTTPANCLSDRNHQKSHFLLTVEKPSGFTSDVCYWARKRWTSICSPHPRSRHAWTRSIRTSANDRAMS